LRFSHEKTGTHARFMGGPEDGRKHVLWYLTNVSSKLTKTCQNQLSNGPSKI
jgi:general stress protein 26